MLSHSRRFLLMLPLMLAACGFSPVYVPGGNGAHLQNTVEVSEPTDRNGFLMTRRIEERLGRSVDPTYKLDIAVSTSQKGLAIASEGSTTRFNILGTATYSLLEVATGHVISSGGVKNFTGYSAADTTVATSAARLDARQRLMILLADQIVTRLLVADLE